MKIQTEATPTSLGTWLGYLAMCLGMFMAILDIQIVASSLPDIQAGLRIPFDSLSWVQTAYLTAEIVAIPLTGWLTARYSLRRLFLVAVTMFTLASLGCAASNSFTMLILFRIAQGAAGGVLIPAAFTAIFMLFPERLHIRATGIGGLFAMTAPMLGPVLGGFITDTFSWPWLFLINLGPGILAGTVAALLLRTEPADPSARDRLDVPTLILLALSLSMIEIGLKEAPQRGWTSPTALALFLISVGAGYAAARRCLDRAKALVDLRLLGDTGFATSCFLSFVLGGVLYGSVYLLPLFLGYVRLHTAFEIGMTMLVAGAVQTLSLPVPVLLVKRVGARLLTGVGYALFAAGLVMNGFATPETDFNGLFWPQVLRGAGVLMCIIPTTSVALRDRHGADLANASAIFNLSRNLGGAISIAIVDTILRVRTELHVPALLGRLHEGDATAAAFVGVPTGAFTGRPIADLEQISPSIDPLVHRAAQVMAFNEAWLLLGIVCAAALLALPLLTRERGARPVLMRSPRIADQRR
jgi:DHA2 family multidrug resistance protein